VELFCMLNPFKFEGVEKIAKWELEKELKNSKLK
jgi:hypothetical protein